MAGGSKISIYGAISANTLIAISKFIAAMFTGSSAMFAEGIHSVIDTGNGMLLLLGISKGKQKPNRRHPFGYGKEEYFWSFVVSIMIFALGGGFAIFEGIHSLQNPPKLEEPTWNYVVILAAIVFEGISLIIAIRHFKKLNPHGSLLGNMIKSKNPAAFAVVIEDSAAVAGLLIALGGVYLSHSMDDPNIDAIASLLIGLLLLLVATFLARETKGLLVGESAGNRVISDIEDILKNTKGIHTWNYPKSMHIGPDTILIVLEITFDKDLSFNEIHSKIKELQKLIHEKVPKLTQLFIQPTTDDDNEELT